MSADHYCNVDDLNAYAGQVPFSARSVPTDTTVLDMIESIANEMDSQLNNVGYVTPLTGPKALFWAKTTCRFGALGLAQDSRATGVNTAVGAGGREGKNIWTQRYEQRMNALRTTKDTDELSDAPRTTSQLIKQSENAIRSSVQSVDDSNWLTPNVTREQVL